MNRPSDLLGARPGRPWRRSGRWLVPPAMGACLVGSLLSIVAATWAAADPSPPHAASPAVAASPPSPPHAASPAVAAAPPSPPAKVDRGVAERLASARQAIRSLGAALVCDGCKGRGTVMRRCVVGYRTAAFGVRQPLFGQREQRCAICDGEGCRDVDRIVRLVRLVADRLDRVPDGCPERTEALVELRRAIAESLACAPKALPLRARELAADALVRSRDGTESVLLVAQSLPTPARGVAASHRSPPDSVDDLLLEAAGTLWRIRGDGVPAASAKGWIAVLGWIEPAGASPPTSVRAGQHVRVVEVRALVCAVFEPPPPPPAPPKKARPRRRRAPGSIEGRRPSAARLMRISVDLQEASMRRTIVEKRLPEALQDPPDA